MKTRFILTALALGLGLTLAMSLFVFIGRAAPGNPILDPAANTHTAPPTTAVSITYDEPISPTTVSTRTFVVHAMQTGLLAQTYSVDDGTISLTPPQPFRPGELVQASATTGIVGKYGSSPISPTVWAFRVAVLGGSGFFADSGQNLGSYKSADIELGDLNGDGDLDVFVVNFGANKVWQNDGMGVYSVTQSLGSGFNQAVALGDVDGDSDLDAFVAHWAGGADKVWLNDGTGIFSDSGQSLGDSSGLGLALGDLDGDGDLDAFVVNQGNADRVWLNDGEGVFSDSGQGLDNSKGTGVALGDLDDDGDLDAFVTNSYQQANTVWLNNGVGTFVINQTLDIANSEGVALGDLDDDGDLDIYVANYAQANKVWLNDGAGIFTVTQSLGNSKSIDIALGDVDGDGDLDAFVTNKHQANKVWLNDGTGTFTSGPQSLGTYWSLGLALGDVDGDGDLDAFVANYGDQPNKVWLNSDQADLSLTKTVTPSTTVPGQIITYTLVYINHGLDVAADVLITDIVPITLTSLSYTYAGAVISPTSGVSYTWQVADLNPGEGGVITITGVVSPSLEGSGVFGLINQATIAAATMDGNPNNNTPVVSSIIDTEPPVAPTLVSPAAGAAISDTTPTLTWQASSSPDAAGYIVDWNGTIVDLGDVTQYTTSILSDGLYTWTVAAYDAVRNTSLYTDTWSFIVDTTPPDVPTLVSPENGAVISDITPMLTWQASSSPDAAGYLLDWNGMVVDVGNVTQYTTLILFDGVYTWTVAAYDAACNIGSYADKWSFTVDVYMVYLPLALRGMSVGP